MTDLTPEVRDETPVILRIHLASGHVEEIDLDEPNWSKTHADYLRVNSIWQLHWKDDRAPDLVMVVHEGDQPYYKAHHVGFATKTVTHEAIAYGIGKKHPAVYEAAVDDDGEEYPRLVRPSWTERLWTIGTTMICMGDDVDQLGLMVARAEYAASQEAVTAQDGVAPEQQPATE